ncbi:MAG: hypothetical protein KDH89_16865 [Anaerolineae bacterium]|nr:hypothetical protein [Anaerolineae bacterium]
MTTRLTWTHQPYNAIWDHILFLSSKANVKKLLVGQTLSNRAQTQIFTDNELVEKKSTQIAYSISQAREYYYAADAVSVATSPLLYFYGMLSLAKALIVANDPNLLLDEIKYHGLSSRPIPEDSSCHSDNGDVLTLEDECAVVKPGVFLHLARLTQGIEIPENHVYCMRQLFSVNPELADSYVRSYGISSQVQYLYDHQEIYEPYRLTLCPRTIDKTSFERLFPELPNDFACEEAVRHNQALVYQSKSTITEFPRYIGIYSPLPGGRYLVRGLDYQSNGAIIVQYTFPELCDYIFMFILSNCVRYKQEFWGKVIRGEESGSIGIMNQAISIARLRFPNFVLSQFYNESFVYGTTARWQ